MPAGQFWFSQNTIPLLDNIPLGTSPWSPYFDLTTVLIHTMLIASLIEYQIQATLKMSRILEMTPRTIISMTRKLREEDH
jgi:hypothetical protein